MNSKVVKIVLAVLLLAAAVAIFVLKPFGGGGAKPAGEVAPNVQKQLKQ